MSRMDHSDFILPLNDSVSAEDRRFEPDSPEQLPVFVYGSLRHGLENYGLLRGRTVSETPATLSGVTMWSLGLYPIIVNSDNAEDVAHGELMILHPHFYSAVMEALDHLEGYYPQMHELCLYRREQRTITTASGRGHLAWTYIGSPTLVQRVRREPVPKGDWARYRRARLEQLRSGNN